MWIATDKDGETYFYISKPVRGIDMWVSEPCYWYRMKNFTLRDLRKYIMIPTWEDEPIEIKVVIKTNEMEESILTEAIKIRCGERNTDYGDVVENMRRITSILNSIQNKEFNEIDVCNVMLAVKLGREVHKHKRDNLVDLCGYADILNILHDNKSID